MSCLVLSCILTRSVLVYSVLFCMSVSQNSSNCSFLLFYLSPLLSNTYPSPSPYLSFQAIPAEILRGTTFAVFWAGSTYFVYTVAPKGLTATMVRTVLYCTVLYCTVLYSTVLYCTVQHCAVLYCTILYCIVLYCTFTIVKSKLKIMQLSFCDGM